MAQIPTAESAINAALSQNWKEAVRMNLILLKADKSDINALNRLGYAYIQNGQIKLAKAAFQKVIKLDQYNQIALKHTKKLGSVKTNVTQPAVTSRVSVSPLSFLEEPGKTKIVAGVNLAPAETISALSPGMEVSLKPRNHCVEVRSLEGIYVAALPDDISFKLLKLIASGYRYQTIVKSVDKKSLVMILRETSRGKRFADQPSFSSAMVSLSSPVHSDGDRNGEKINVSATGEADDTDTDDGDDATGVKNDGRNPGQYEP